MMRKFGIVCGGLSIAFMACTCAAHVGPSGFVWCFGCAGWGFAIRKWMR